MERMLGSVGWWFTVSAVLHLGGWSGGMRAWWRPWIGATLITTGLLGVGAALTAPAWLSVCVAHVGGTTALFVSLLRYQQRVRGATSWRNAVRLTWQSLRTSSRQLWASLPQRRRQAWAWWQHTGQYLLNWREWLLWSVLLVIGRFALTPLPGAALTPLVTLFVDTTRTLGMQLIIFLVLLETILVITGMVQLTDAMLRTIKRIVVFTWLLAFVIQIGPSFEELAQQSPRDAVLLAGVLVVLASVVRQVPVRVQSASMLTTTPGIDGVRYGIPRKPAMLDRETCAIHEAGHALLYATPLPWHSDITAVVYAVPQHGRGGYVTAPFWDQMNTTATMVEWHMLLYLAGQAAEHALRGTSCMGSSDDYQRWHTLAIDYIANGHGPAASPHPLSKVEQVRHDQAIVTLRMEQRCKLATFFEINRQPLQDLADALCRQQILHTDDLRCFWERVEIPEGFPRPMWTPATAS